MERPAVLTKPNIVTREDLAWAAGLFEGEGCIYGRKEYSGVYPVVSLTSTDFDTVTHFHTVVGGLGIIYKRKPRKAPNSDTVCKEQWEWTAFKFEHAQAVLALLWGWLKSRRQQRIIEILGNGKNNPNSHYDRKFNKCGIEGCKDKYYCRGLCRKHYGKARYHGISAVMPEDAKVCSVNGCRRLTGSGTGLCIKHYQVKMNHQKSNVDENT